MLVPAIAFGWWLVSISSPMGAHVAHGRTRAVPVAEASATHAVRDDTERAAGDTDDADDDATPAEYEDGDGAGERIRLKVVTPAIVRAARTFLDLPMGAERSMTIDGNRYLFVLEHHYHPPGFVGGPHGWHKGVTVYGLR
jgi:hypothetical protein